MLELHFAKLVPNVDFLGPLWVLARVLPRVRRFVAWFRWDFSPSKHHQVHELLKEIALKSSSSLTWKIRIGGITADLHSGHMECGSGFDGRWTVSQYIWSATVLFATEVLIPPNFDFPTEIVLQKKKKRQKKKRDRNLKESLFFSYTPFLLSFTLPIWKSANVKR